MKKFKVESLKVNILTASQLKNARSNGKFSDKEIYIQEPNEFVGNYEAIQDLKSRKQDKLKAGKDISITSSNVINAEVDLSPYYTKSDTARLFMGRNETYTREEIDRKTGLSAIEAGELIKIDSNNGKVRVSSLIKYKETENGLALGREANASYGLAIGKNARSEHENSIAIGNDSQTKGIKEFSVGNNTIKRRITNVEPAKYDDEAVTLSQLKKELSSIKEQMNTVAKGLYPVGSVYISVNDVNPSTLLGGTWERLPAGRMLIGAGDGYTMGQMGGEKEHRLTEQEMPSHNHGGGEEAGAHTHTRGSMDITGSFVSGLQSSKYGGVTGAFYYEREQLHGPCANKGDPRQIAWFKASRAWTGETSVSGGHTHNFKPAGGNQPHNNMPPFIVVNMWKRIS